MKQNESTNLFCLYFLALSTIDIQYDLTYYIHINIRASKWKTMELYIYIITLVSPLSVCLSDAKLLRDRWSDWLHFWSWYWSHTRDGSYLFFMTLGQRSRSPQRSRSSFFFKVWEIWWTVQKIENIFFLKCHTNFMKT